MTIRNRLLVLLLAIALTPLILTSLLQQVSIRVARDRLASRTRQTLEANARLELQEQLQGRVQVLDRDRKLADALLSRQAREIELRLAGLTPPLVPQPPGPPNRPSDPNFRGEGPPPRPGFGEQGPGELRGPGFRGGRGRGPRGIAQSDLRFGFDGSLASRPQSPHLYLEGRADSNTPRLPVDYQAQSCFVTRENEPNGVKSAMEDLAGMTAVYHQIYDQGPKGILWLYTSLDRIGLSTTYPGGVAPLDVNSYDPGTLLPYRRGRFAPGNREGEVRMVDPFTNQVVVVRSLVVHYADLSEAGVTAMARTIPEVFESMELPARWGTGVKRMLIVVDPNARPFGPQQFMRGARDPRGGPATESGPRARVLLRDDVESGVQRGRRGGPIPPEPLESSDSGLLRKMMDDILADKPGIQVMGYQERRDDPPRKCLWAYQPLGIPQVAALLIVPYDSVIALSKTMEESLLTQGWYWLQGTTLVLLGVGIVAVVLAALKARSVTDPIHALIEAGRKLGNGDYDARVNISTGDEFENLGRVFNEAGPQLREREKMKRSLELAAATQQNLLPARSPELEHFDVVGRCLYCDETGGDYYDFIDLSGTDGRRVGLASGDVSGHGIGAALLMAATRGMLHAEAERYADDLSSLIHGLNRRLVRDAVDGQFITLFYGILEDRTRSLTWVSAGHEPAIWYHARSGQVEELANTGMPLGVELDTTYGQAGPITLEPGDVLVMSTDGIREARNKDDEFFGGQRVVDIIRDKSGLSADQICTAIIDAVTRFVLPAPRTDDITLVIVKAST
jgi:sigma-B regulation protein RsbU (phosphoserine phosphatase)